MQSRPDFSTTFTGIALETNAARLELGYKLNEVFEVAPQTVEPPDHEGVTLLYLL